jgi:hypothetical protein
MTLMTKISLDEHAERCIWHDGNEIIIHDDKPPGEVYSLERKYLPTGQIWEIKVRAITFRALMIAFDRWNTQSPGVWAYKVIFRL